MLPQPGPSCEEKAQVGTLFRIFNLRINVKIEELYQLEPGAGGEQKSVSGEWCQVWGGDQVWLDTAHNASTHTTTTHTLLLHQTFVH